MAYPIPVDIIKNPVFSRIYANLHEKNMNQIILFFGLPRTGKSNACVDFGWVLDRNPKTGEHRFNINNVCNTGKELVEKTRASDSIGQAFVWEEAGVSTKGAAARKWQNDMNQLMADLFQFMGFKRHLILVNLPANFLLDKAPRSLAHAIVSCKRVDKKRRRVRASFKWVNTNPELGKTYYKSQRYYDSAGVLKRARSIMIPRAPKDLYKEYERYQRDYKDIWFGELIQRMDVMQEKGKKKVMLEADDLFERTKSKLNDMILPGRKTVSPGLVKRVVSQQLQEFEGFSYQSLRDLRGLLNNALLRG